MSDLDRLCSMVAIGIVLGCLIGIALLAIRIDDRIEAIQHILTNAEVVGLDEKPE